MTNRRQGSLPIATDAPAVPVAGDVERDLFGNPVAASHAAGPTYRPRKPAQQLLDLAPGTFTLR